MYRFHETTGAPIASGATTSTAAESRGLKLGGVIFPSAMTNTTLAIEVSSDGTTFYPAYDSDGVAITVPVKTGGWVCMLWQNLVAPYVRLVGSSNEAAYRAIRLFFCEG